MSKGSRRNARLADERRVASVAIGVIMSEQQQT